MRPKNVLMLFIIVFVISGLLVDSVFATQMDLEKEISPLESVLETELSLVQEKVDGFVENNFQTPSTFS